MEKALTQSIALRLKRKFKRSVFSGLFTQRSRQNRTHTIPALEGICQSSRAEPCSYRTRLEDHQPRDGDEEQDLEGPVEEEVPLRRFPRRYEALMEGQRHGLLANSSTTLPGIDDDPDDDIVPTRTSMTSWTSVEADDAQGNSQPRSSISTAHGSTSTISWSRVDWECGGICSTIRSRERAAPGEMRVLDPELGSSTGGHICSDLSSRRVSVTSPKLAGTEMRDYGRARVAGHAPPESIITLDIAQTAPRAQSATRSGRSVITPPNRHK